MLPLLGLLGKLVAPVFSIIDKFVEDKDEANNLKAQIQSQFIGFMTTELEAQKAIIVAEAQGGSWLQRSWRPLTMLVFVFIVANNYILFPYGIAFGLNIPALPTPPELWTLINIGLGGYVVGRSAEKVAKVWKEKE